MNFQLLVFFAILTVAFAGIVGPGAPESETTPPTTQTTPTTPWTQTTPKEGIVSKFHRFLEAAYLSPGNFWTYFLAFLANFNVVIPIGAPGFETGIPRSAAGIGK